MKRKKQLYKILAAFVFFAAAYLFSSAGIWRPLLFSASFLTAGLPVIRKAVRNIGHGQVFDENFLMSIATVGAFALGEYSEGAAVMLFYQVGELFQSYAVDKSRRSIAALMDIRPDYATVDRDGKLEKVSPEEVVPGDIIIVRAGEKIPLDGIVTDGNALLDTAALTGEPVPREVAPGDEVVSGCININGRLSIRVTKSFGESTVARILDLVENASSKKANMENFITKFARYYTPAVVLAAAAIAVLPPLLAEGAAFQEWIYRALTFLVVSCPCALVISIPLGFFGGIGAASRNGILVKGGNYLEALASAEIVVFDKTGTLTKGRFDVAEVHPEYIDEKKLLELAAYAGSSSGHPVSLSIRKAFARPIEQKRVSEVTELPGYGVRAIVDGSEIYLGNARLMAEQGIVFEPADKPGTIVYLAENGVYQGYIRICDEIRADAAAAVSRLKEGGIKRTVMLTGDNRNTGAEVAQALKLDGFFAELLPEQKVAKMEELLKEKTPSGKLVFAGDGINDAPVLALSDIGIAMGGIGSDAAVEAADIVIMTDEPSKIAQAIRISKTTLCIVKENIIFALGVKFLVLGLGVAGIATMWDAVFADVGVSVLAILNSVRALKAK